MSQKKFQRRTEISPEGYATGSQKLTHHVFVNMELSETRPPKVSTVPDLRKPENDTESDELTQLLDENDEGELNNEKPSFMWLSDSYEVMSETPKLPHTCLSENLSVGLKSHIYRSEERVLRPLTAHGPVAHCDSFTNQYVYNVTVTAQLAEENDVLPKGKTSEEVRTNGTITDKARSIEARTTDSFARNLAQSRKVQRTDSNISDQVQFIRNNQTFTDKVHHSVEVSASNGISTNRLQSDKVGATDKIITSVKMHPDKVKTSGSITDENEVQFLVGRDQQLMVGQKPQLEDVSCVFKAMFKHDERLVIPIPDVQPKAFGVLLRFADGEKKPDITADNVWDVLQVADKYDVRPLTDLCFSYLAKKHPLRYRSSHLCCVLEMAHRLQYKDSHQLVLGAVQKNANKVLKNPRALDELCQQCLLQIIQADDLKGVDEIVVHNAMLTWARQACIKQGKESPGWKELREVAGDLVKHVRYLMIPRKDLNALFEDDSSPCLLNAEEKQNLLRGNASLFPSTVSRKRAPKPKSKLDKFKTKLLKALILAIQLLFAGLCLLLGLLPVIWVAWVIIGSAIQPYLTDNGSLTNPTSADIVNNTLNTSVVALENAMNNASGTIYLIDSSVNGTDFNQTSELFNQTAELFNLTAEMLNS